MAGFQQLTLQQGLHQATALAAMTLFITAHRAIINTGFTLRRRGLSTDVLTVFMIGAITTLWTLLVVLSGLVLEDKPCRKGLHVCAARLAYVPWILQLLFVFWLVAYVNQIWYLRRRDAERIASIQNRDQKSDLEADAPVTASRRSAALRPLKLWKMEATHGNFNWSGSVSREYRLLIHSTILTTVCLFSYGAAREKLYTISLLNVVGVVLFIVGAGGNNRYAGAPHIHTADTLRVVLHTDHKEGTVYVLPSKGRGFDAVWSPRMANEFIALDEAIAKFREAGGRSTSRIPDLTPVLAAFHSSTQLTSEDIRRLAGWLYQPENYPEMQNIACNRAPGVHLISDSVMSALMHAEYLVFMRRTELNEELKSSLGALRSPRWSGADISKDIKQLGSRPGHEGYQEAVRYVYRLFNEPIDENALMPTASPPKKSVLLDPCPETIEGYIGALWDHFYSSQGTVFADLYAFLQIWWADIGSGNGFHPFPFRSIDREGDIVSWHIIWRQAWYLAIIAQLTSMSPIIFSAFLAGILH